MYHAISDTFVLYTDASGWELGACLHDIREEELLVALYSHQLQGAEHHYSVTELESLSIVAAVERVLSVWGCLYCLHGPSSMHVPQIPQ